MSSTNKEKLLGKAKTSTSIVLDSKDVSEIIREYISKTLGVSGDRISIGDYGQITVKINGWLDVSDKL